MLQTFPGRISFLMLSLKMISGEISHAAKADCTPAMTHCASAITHCAPSLLCCAPEMTQSASAQG